MTFDDIWQPSPALIARPSRRRVPAPSRCVSITSFGRSRPESGNGTRQSKKVHFRCTFGSPSSPERKTRDLESEPCLTQHATRYTPACICVHLRPSAVTTCSKSGKWPSEAQKCEHLMTFGDILRALNPKPETRNAEFLPRSKRRNAELAVCRHLHA
jgi:hypothetical protein